MGRRADIVHSDRLKPYPTPTKNSIRRTQPEEDTPTKHVKNTNKNQTDSIQEDTADLIDKIQTFLDPEQVIGKRKKSPAPKQQPPPPPEKIVTKHRKRRNQIQYLVHDVGSSPKTGEWLRANEAPAIPLANYLKAQDNYPATRSKSKLMPRVGSITLPTKHQVS